jgi:hypothetical protein
MGRALIAYLIGRGLTQKLLTWGAPLSEGRALIAYLIGRGLIQKLPKPESGTQLCMENECRSQGGGTQTLQKK